MPEPVPIPVIRDDRGGLAFVQWPDQLPTRPAGAAWQSLQPDQRIPAAPDRTLSWLVANGGIWTAQRDDDAQRGRLDAFTRVASGAVSGAASSDGATVVAFLEGEEIPAPDKRPPASVGDCRIVALGRSADWTVASAPRHIPFSPERAYFLFDVPRHAERGAHAHIALHQLVVALRGSFEVELSDGRERTTHVLSDDRTGLYVPPGLWRDLREFDAGAVCMVLASARFDPADYIRDYDDFLTYRGYRS